MVEEPKTFSRRRWGPWAPRYLAARHYEDSNGARPPNWDWAAKALEIPAPAPLSELAPPISPMNVRENLPQSGTASLVKGARTDDFLPSPNGIPPSDLMMRSATPTYRGGLQDKPGPKPAPPQPPSFRV